MKKLILSLLLLLVPSIFGTASSQLTGAGSTLAAPFYDQVIPAYEAAFPKAWSVIYNAIGSGAGVAALQQGSVNFAGSDVILTSSQIAGFSGPVLTFPAAVVGVSIAYNLPGSPAITLTAQQIADIYEGTITNWSQIDSSIDLPIFVVARSDSSGTTGIFTQFLADSNIGWPSDLVGTQVTFPATNQTVTSTNAMIQALNANVGSIGYVSFGGIPLGSPLASASVVNSSGNAIAPSIDSLAAAQNDVVVTPSLTMSLVNSSDPAAYPLTNYTYIIITQNQPNLPTLVNVGAFIDYVATTGQQFTIPNNFAPLSDAVVAQIVANFKLLSTPGTNLLIELIYYKYCFLA